MSLQQRVADGFVADLVASGEHLFWLGDGTLWRNRNGEAPDALASFDGRGLRIAVDEDAIFWAFSADHTKKQSSLRRLARDLSSSLTLLDGKQADGVVAHAFVLSRRGILVAAGDGSIRELPRSELAPDRMHWAHFQDWFPFEPRGLAVADSFLFFSKIPQPDALPSFEGLKGVHLVRGQDAVFDVWSEYSTPGPLAGDDHHLYFSHRGGGGRIRRFTPSSGQFLTLVDGVDARALAVHDGFLYWNDGSSVGRVPVQGGAIEKIACGVDLDLVSVANGHIFWTEGHQRILRAPLPPGVAQVQPAAPPLAAYQGPTNGATVQVRALIDGDVQLFFKGNQLWWRILRGAQPGWAGVKIKPSQVDGVSWLPEYPSSIQEQIGYPLLSCNCNSLPRAIPHPVAQVMQPATVTFSGRGNVFIAQQPTPENEGVLVVEIRDFEDGPEWYDLTLSYTAEASL